MIVFESSKRGQGSFVMLFFCVDRSGSVFVTAKTEN